MRLLKPVLAAGTALALLVAAGAANAAATLRIEWIRAAPAGVGGATSDAPAAIYGVQNLTISSSAVQSQVAPLPTTPPNGFARVTVLTGAVVAAWGDNPTATEATGLRLQAGDVKLIGILSGQKLSFLEAADAPFTPAGGATAANQSTELTSIGATSESAAANPSATSGLNGLLKGLWTTVRNAIGSTGSAAPTTAILAGGTDGTNLRGIKTDTSGNQLVVGQAGENHVGEVGGNVIAVSVAQTVTASSAYTSGNAVGGLMTIAGAARVSGSSGAAGTSGLLQSVVTTAKTAQAGAIDVFMFNANPTGSTCTDKTAFALATADLDKVFAVIHVTDWTSGGTPSVGQAMNQAAPYALSSSTTVYACAVTRSTPTYGSTSDVAFSFRFMRN